MAHTLSDATPTPRRSQPLPATAWLKPPEIVLDVSRLLSRLLHPSPTGVDRVEMAYARTLQRLIPGRLAFGAVHPTGLYGRLDAARVSRFLDETEARWERSGGDESWRHRCALALHQSLALQPSGIAPAIGRRVVLQSSPHHLHDQALVSAKLAREKARFVCLVHDLIPITHPEYARPGGAKRHRDRMMTLQVLADGLLANSTATAEALRAQAGNGLDGRKVIVAPLGTHVQAEPSTACSVPDTNYFVCLSTIEPRKNHLLLLHVWRSMVEALGRDRTPRLVLVGRRGWENENIVDLLDRCEQLKGVVVEQPRLADDALRQLLQGARALLMPSFVEGFGLPVAEALAAGVPVLASDIAAHREAGGAVPDYIDPIDGIAWRKAVLDYSAGASLRRRSQIERMKGWRPNRWENHLEMALALAEEVAWRAT